jgi:ketosteroid isomerase-like protein
LHATFAQGDLQGFLDGCTDDVAFTVPGNTPGSGMFTKASFTEWITGGSAKPAARSKNNVPVHRLSERGNRDVRHATAALNEPFAVHGRGGV